MPKALMVGASAPAHDYQERPGGRRFYSLRGFRGMPFLRVLTSPAFISTPRGCVRRRSRSIL